MRSFLAKSFVATGAMLATIQFVFAAATIPDNQARVNTASAFKQDANRNANASIDPAAPTKANRVQFYAIPSRRW